MKRCIFLISLVWIVYAFGIGTSMPQAQPYPSHPVQIVVPNEPGSMGDMAARAFAEELSKVLKTPSPILNKPGASATLGIDFVSKSKKNGYTIVYASTSGVVYARVINPEIVSYDPDKDLEPLGLHCYVPLTLTVQENSPWKTFNELIDYAKKNPGAIRCSVHGQGSIDHFNLEIIKSLTGAELTIIPFKGTAAVTTALLGGHVDAAAIAEGLVSPHVKAGKLKMLVLSIKMREHPNVPTINELGYTQNLLSGWFAWFGPAGMPETVKKVLIAAIETTTKIPELVQRIEKLGLPVDYKSPEELKKLMTSDYETARAIAVKLGLSK